MIIEGNIYHSGLIGMYYYSSLVVILRIKSKYPKQTMNVNQNMPICILVIIFIVTSKET